VKTYLSLLFLLLLGKAGLVLGVMLFSGIGLGPDEAQYWTWSQQLDWGYYSKPPGIAWEIWLGTKLLGNSELGVRFGALILGTLLPWALFCLAKRCGLSMQASFWAAAAFAFSPMGILASFLAITDTGMLLFWILACLVVADGIKQQRSPKYALVGALIACGALFKWPIYFFWPLLLSSWLLFPALISRRVIGGVIGGMLLSLLGLLPSVYWNAAHEWATFRHVLATMLGGSGPSHLPENVSRGNFFEFLGAQAALISPLLFLLMLWAFVGFFKAKANSPAPVRFCALVSLLLLTGFACLAFFMKMQGNWCLFAYASAFVLLAWYWVDQRHAQKWLALGCGVSLLLTGTLFSIPALQSKKLLSGLAIPYRWNPFHHNVGWDALNQELAALNFDPRKDFLFSDKYQTASILSFYNPAQARAYFFNLQGARKNQFSYWPGSTPDQQRGFFVAVERMDRWQNSLAAQIEAYQAQLQPYFQEVAFAGLRPLFMSGQKPVKAALIFECTVPNGQLPHPPNRY
jgi:hypothetical protein